MTDQQISTRGLEAAQILESRAFKDGIEALRQATVAVMKTVGTRDNQGLAISAMYMKLADTFESILAGYMEAGKFADHNLRRAMDSVRDESPARRLMRRVL